MTKPMERPVSRPNPVPESTGLDDLRAEHAAGSAEARTLPTLFGFGGFHRWVRTDLAKDSGPTPEVPDHREPGEG
jgi:hypothetical protein